MGSSGKKHYSMAWVFVICILHFTSLIDSLQHFLSLPLFTPFYSDLIQTYNAYTSSPSLTLLSIPRPSASLFPALFTENPTSFSSAKYFDWHELLIPSAMFALALNLITQGLCVRGVNRLTTRVNSVTVNLVLTVRKAVSLAISVWYYGSGLTWSLVVGGAMVLCKCFPYCSKAKHAYFSLSGHHPLLLRPRSQRSRTIRFR